MADHIFKKEELIEIFSQVVNKTLGEVDKNNVFSRTIKNPKITGIAGDVIEQSVLGYPADTKQSADLLVDGVETELKTTGIKYTKKGKKNNQNHIYEAKEPMSITAVSPDKIVFEEFYSSRFWNKLEHSLYVYYLYDSDKTVKAADYAHFPIKGYDFHEFNETDTKILMNDWLIVRDFIRNLKDNHEKPEEGYPNISKLREQMMYLDTAPKWPNRPRFRLKRHVVTEIVQEFFSGHVLEEKIKRPFYSYKELDEQLHEFTERYRGKTLSQLGKALGIETNNKSAVEQVVARLFDDDAKKLRQIDVFAKLGVLPKTMILTSKGGRTEDTKFDTIDFEEWCNPKTSFLSSSVYDFFASQTMLFTIFRETGKNTPLAEIEFFGFKRLQFSDEFINGEVHRTWMCVRELVNQRRLKIIVSYDKNGEVIINNKTKTVKEAPNFPKSSEYDIFLRGTSVDSTYKPLVLNGLRMYNQQFWIKGSSLVNLLNEIDFI